MYTKYVNGDCVIICLYVDDMFIYGTWIDIVLRTKVFLESKFDMKVMGETSVILGIKIIRISQNHYVGKLLRKVWLFYWELAAFNEFSRSNIAYVVGRLNRYIHSPNQDHWDAIARLPRYLRGTMDYGIEYSGFLVVLERYSDANWISDLDDTKSTSDYVSTLGVVRLHRDHLVKLLQLDQQWN